MLRPAMNDMVKNTRDSYAFVVGIAKRARKIAEASEENGEILEKKPVQLAVCEFEKHPWDITTRTKER